MNRLLLLATGGTIAGCAENSATLNNYTAGVLGGDALLAAVPQLQELAAIDVEQVANVDSADLLFAHWRALVGRIRDAFTADPGLAGGVITHGTNTRPSVPMAPSICCRRCRWPQAQKLAVRACWW